jgi:hypothetical protein
MKGLLVLGWLILTTSLVGQVEHAPTVAQCQADQRLWMSEVNEGDSPRLPTYNVLQIWENEMSDCQKVDADNRLKYYNTQEEIGEMQHIRLLNFLSRHRLVDKFAAEDAAGKR